MYTEQIKRRKSNAFFQMKTINAPSQKDKVIQKLGSSIYASMDRLKSLKAEIMTSGLGNLKSKIIEFQRQHASFMDKQKSLMEIQQNSDKIDRLKIKIKQFLQSFSADEIERKLASLKEDHIRESHREINMQAQQQIQAQKYEGESFRKKLLDDEDQQLREIEKMMAVVKQIAIDTSQLVLGIGAKLNIASESMKQARLKMQQARKQLVETNKYEQDASKMKIFFCALVTVIIIIIFLLFKAANKK